MSIIEDYKDIIESRKTDGATMEKKIMLGKLLLNSMELVQ